MNGERLLVRLEADTRKSEAKYAKFVANTVAGASEIDRSFANTNKRLENGFKSAAKSASVFERELGRADRQVDQLRASLDPTFAATLRLAQSEKILADAFKRGSINAEEHARSLQLVRAQSTGLANQTAGLGAATAKTGGAFGKYRGQIQNTSFQIGDFAVQVGAGTAASVALGQQLPQLLGGFGALGAVLGAIVAIGVPLGAALKAAAQIAGDVAPATGEIGAAADEAARLAENLGIAISAASRLSVLERKGSFPGRLDGGIGTSSAPSSPDETLPFFELLRPPTNRLGRVTTRSPVMTL